MIMFMYNIFILDFLELREDNFCKVNKWGRKIGRIIEKVNSLDWKEINII